MNKLAIALVAALVITIHGLRLNTEVVTNTNDGFDLNNGNWTDIIQMAQDYIQDNNMTDVLNWAQQNWNGDLSTFSTGRIQLMNDTDSEVSNSELDNETCTNETCDVNGGNEFESFAGDSCGTCGGNCSNGNCTNPACADGSCGNSDCTDGSCGCTISIEGELSIGNWQDQGDWQNEEGDNGDDEHNEENVSE